MRKFLLVLGALIMGWLFELLMELYIPTIQANLSTDIPGYTKYLGYGLVIIALGLIVANYFQNKDESDPTRSHVKQRASSVKNSKVIGARLKNGNPAPDIDQNLRTVEHSEITGLEITDQNSGNPGNK